MFKVGDRVKYVSGKWYDNCGNPLWGGKSGKIAGEIIKEIRGSILFNYEVRWDNNYVNGYHKEDLELVNSNNNKIMSNIKEFFVNLKATPEERLLKEMGMENPIGTPTQEGLELSALISYQANRAEIIKIAQAKKAEETK